MEVLLTEESQSCEVAPWDQHGRSEQRKFHGGVRSTVSSKRESDSGAATNRESNIRAHGRWWREQLAAKGVGPGGEPAVFL
jgi:hypothetical protein